MAVRKRTWKTSGGETKQAWVAEYTDQGGKRHLETFEKKKDADARLAQIKVEVGRGIHTPVHQSVTVDFAGEKWLEACEARGLERTSVESYRQHFQLHIHPFLGHTKLAQVTASTIREFEDSLRAGKCVPGDPIGRSRSSDMIKRVVRSLGTLLTDAQERNLVARNVVRDLRAGRGRGTERRHKGRLQVGVDIPTREEVKAIMKEAKGPWRPILLTAVLTGLRSSELRGLRWRDVDLTKRELHVRQRADNRGIMGNPKSDTSRRTVPVPPVVTEALGELSRTAPCAPNDLVFATCNGRPQNHSNVVQRGLQVAQVHAGVTGSKGEAKYPGLHSLRHFYASWCINSRADGGLGLPPKVVQERLGHSTIVLTMDRYGHLFPREQAEADELAVAEQALLA